MESTSEEEEACLRNHGLWVPADLVVATVVSAYKEAGAHLPQQLGVSTARRSHFNPSPETASSKVMFAGGKGTWSMAHGNAKAHPLA